MTSPTTAERIRLTISVTPDVHAAYTRLSKATGASIGREMGDWLASTLESVELTTSMIERARVAPQTVMRELNAHADALHQVVKGDLASLLAEMGRVGNGEPGGAALVATPGSRLPPFSNTGGKVPRVNPKLTGGRDAKPKRRSPALSEKKGS